jgi:hypothetical protein
VAVLGSLALGKVGGEVFRALSAYLHNTYIDKNTNKQRARMFAKIKSGFPILTSGDLTLKRVVCECMQIEEEGRRSNRSGLGTAVKPADA